MHHKLIKSQAFRLGVIGTIAAATAAIGFAAPSASAANPPSPSGTATIQLNGAMRVLPVDIANKIKSGKPETLTPAEAKTLTRLVPPDGHPTLVVNRAPTGGTAHPDNVSRCGGYSGLVCIDVRSYQGHGNLIEQWNTVWDLPAAVWDCFTEYDYWANYKQYSASNQGCGYAPVNTYWYPDLYFAVGNAKSYYIGLDHGNSGAVTFQITY